jgi:hypothetical protein
MMPPVEGDYRADFCGAKRIYSKRAAHESRNRALRRRHNRPDFLRVYNCPRCNGWHLTHLTREEAGEE